MQITTPPSRTFKLYITHAEYLLTTFILSLFYISIMLAGLVLSVLSIFVFGIPFLILFVFIWWKIAAFERWRTMTMLKIDIQPMAGPLPKNMSRIRLFQFHMSRPVVWKSFLYLWCIFPFALLAFCITIILPLLVLVLSITWGIICLLVSPFVYLIATLSGVSIDGKKVKRYILSWLSGGGVLLWMLDILIILSQLWGQFARTMLGMNDQQVRLAQANAIAEQERERAMKAEQSRKELIINVSHELRTPVASIRGHIESLLHTCDTKNPKPEELRNYLNIVHRETLRLGSLVEDLLSVARAEQHELRITLAPTRVDEIIEDVYHTLMPLAQSERQITLIRNINPSLPPVQVDRQRLTQVIINLVRNAITYTPDGGIVSLMAQSAPGDRVEIMVADTGIGIPEEDRERIFERFYRTDGSRTRSTGGFGLGLAIVRDFIIAMEGTITVESEVGTGSCFHIFLKQAQK